jgi:O-antigen/teichoic acid export membrane protein
MSSPQPTGFRSLLRLEAKSAVIYTGAVFVQDAVRFLVVPLFWTKLEPRDYGFLAVNEIIAGILTFVVGLGLDQSLTRFYHEWSDAEKARQTGTLWIANWTSTLLLMALAYALLRPCSAYLFPEVPFDPVISLGLLSTALTSLVTIVAATLRIQQRAWLFAVTSLLSSLLVLGLSVWFVYVLNRGLLGLLTAYVIGGLINTVLWVGIMLRLSRPCFDTTHLREYLRFSLPQVPAAALAVLSHAIDRFLLQRYASVETLGIYAISAKFAGLVSQAYVALKMSYVPFLASAAAKGREFAQSMISRMALMYLAPLALLGLVLGVFTKDFVLFVGRPQYFPVVDWVPLLVVPSLLNTLPVLFAPGLFIAKRSDLMWIRSAVQLGACAAAAILLIPRFQLGGVVAARYVTAIAYVAVSIYLSQLTFRIPFDWLRVAGVLLVLGLGLFAGTSWNIEGQGLGFSLRLLVLAGFTAGLVHVVAGPAGWAEFHRMARSIVRR